LSFALRLLEAYVSILMEYRVAPSNLFGGGLAGKACLSRLGEGRGRSGVCKFLVSFVLERPIKA